MSFWNRLTNQFIDVIEWIDSTNDTLVYRFPVFDNEIKNGAKLTVREGQMAVFVSEGQIADVFNPGMYELQTENMPVLSTLQAWPHGFRSPFKAEVYFFSTRRFVDQKWGTRNPIIMRDPEFGPIRLRSFGTYGFRVSDPERFLREIAGTDGEFTTEEISGQLRNLIVSRFSNIISKSKIPVLDMAANSGPFSEFLKEHIQPDFEIYGLELSSLLVENISLPPTVEKALDARTSIGMVGSVDAFTKFQTGLALGEAGDASSQASGALGLGLGLVVAQQLAHKTETPPPPLPAPSLYLAEDGQQKGPFDLSNLSDLIKTEKLKEDTLIWMQGMDSWTKAATVPQLAQLFGDKEVPPPLPKPPAL